MTPAAEYKRVLTDLLILAERIPGVLADHAKRQEQHPKHWCFVGDLKKTRRDLVETLAFLGDYDAKEELQFIAKSEGQER